MTPLRLEAPAKLNLSLRVTGRRPDGFHELDGEMVLLELADGLLLMPGCSGLRVEPLAGDAGEVPLARGANLAWRGLVAGLGSEPDAWCLTLQKRIPAAAGLGGGSSDAAAGWRLGRRAAGLPEDAGEAALTDLSGIGADVPFFAAALPAARVSGIGERVTEAPAPAGGSEVVLVHPPFALGTAAVFGELRPTDWGGAASPGHNDLLAPALRLRPELADVLRLLAGAGLEPHLSGSGPTVFGTTDDPDRAAAVAARVARGGLRTTLTRLRTEAARIESLSDTNEDG
jgi:4-diphosphocytidyl-2-C-methyl-D-erythritol kinase